MSLWPEEGGTACVWPRARLWLSRLLASLLLSHAVPVGALGSPVPALGRSLGRGQMAVSPRHLNLSPCRNLPADTGQADGQRAS